MVEKQESLVFTYTECKVDNKTAFKWNNLFQAFQSKEFQVLFQYDLSIELRKRIYRNISRFGLYQATTKPPVQPCPDVVQWMTQRIDHERITIFNFEGKHASIYQAPMLNQMYHFKEAQVRVTPEWLQRKFESINFLTIMKGWWSKGNFRLKPIPAGWKTSMF